MELDIFQRIGHDVRRLPLLRDTTSTYAGIASMLTNRLKAGETGATADAAWSNAHRAIENIALRQYMQWQPAGYSEKSQITGISRPEVEVPLRRRVRQPRPEHNRQAHPGLLDFGEPGAGHEG